MRERTAALTGGVALLERAIGFAVASLRLVTPDRLGQPTPCADWDLRALLTHMNDSLAALIEAADFGSVEVSRPIIPEWSLASSERTHCCSDDSEYAHCESSGDGICEPSGDRMCTRCLIQSLCSRAHYLLGAWSRADGPDLVSVDDCHLTGSIVAGAGAIEVAVHGWDVAAACGQSREIPSVLADELLELARVIIEDADRPQRFGRSVNVPAAASASDRLVAFTGRQPS